MTGAVSGIFLFLLVFSPLAFGTVEPWSLAAMETLSVFALLLHLSGKLKERGPVFFTVPGIVPLLLLLSYMAVQLIPLPPLLIKHLSPETYALYERTLGTTGPLPWISLSISRKASLMEFFRISAYVSFYLLTVQLLTKGTFLKKTVAVVILLAFLLAFQAMLQYLLPNGRIYWLRELSGGGHAFGPYVNRNHFAGFMGMVFPVALAVFLAYKPVIRAGLFRERFTGLFSSHETNTFVLLGGAVIIISMSVFLSTSRGGILSLCSGMIFFSILYFSRTRDRKSLLLVILISFLLVISVSWFGWETIFDRFEKVMDDDTGRIIQWKDSLNIIRAFPLTGTGFGSFSDIFKGFSSLSWYAAVDHAQNDYLELLSEGGIIAFFLMGWFLASVFSQSWRMFLKRTSGYSSCLYIGSISGMVGILTHSMTDFNLHVGANGLYFFFLAGLAVSAAGTRLQSGTQDTLLPSKKTRHLRGMSVFLGALLVVSLSLNSGILAGGYYFSLFRGNGPGRQERTDYARIRDYLSKASLFDPLEAEYQYRLAVTEELLDDSGASDHYRKAVEKSPASGEYLQGYALFLARAGKDDIAEKLLRSGIVQDISNPDRHRVFAEWLLSRQKREEAFKEIRKAISMKPADTKDYIALLVLNGVEDKEIARALPEQTGVYMLFADYLSATGDKRMASQYYQTLLDDQPPPGKLQPGYFFDAYAFYLKEGMDGDAVKIMQKAVSLFPDNTEIHIRYAEALVRAGQTKQAVVEYRKLLLGDPSNARAKAALKQLGFL